jgi:uncharacterized protein (DUF58 family)
MGNHTSHHRAGAGPGVIRITRAGWFYILLTIFLGVSGINTGNNLIYLIVAAFLSFMGVSGFFGKRNISAIDVRLELPGEIYANTDVPVKITIRNKRRFLPAFLIRVHLSQNEVLCPFVDVKGEATTYLTLSFHERGHVKIGTMYLSSVFPFNFFVRYRTIPGVYDALVFPGVKKCDSLGLFERERRYRGEQALERTGYEADIISVRDYIEGDPIKYIHWKASAKTGRLKTKELSSLSHRPIVIDFDAIPIRDVEERISCVTYVLLKLFRQNIPVGLRISGAVHKPPKAGGEGTKALRFAMLTKLALYQKE